jgi:protoheme IX farnesyltransferase
VAAGAFVAAGPTVELLLVLHAVLGTALVAGGASALNHLIERRRDAQMRRTEGRPLPAGRLQPLEALVFGLALAVGGVTYLAVALPTPWAALIAAATFALYVGLYTPLKPITPLNTLIGAVPGALPPVIGCVAVRGRLGWEAAALFAILFLWQVPHFLAIAWIYRDDYARAGYRMLPVVDPDGRRTAWHMIAFCVALLAASLLPVMAGPVRWVYLAGALALGGAFLVSALRFRRQRTAAAARAVLRWSLVYLPGLFAGLLLEAACAWLLGPR